MSDLEPEPTEDDAETCREPAPERAGAALAGSCWLEGPAGPLEAILSWPATDRGRHAALFCHPHPLNGGNMHSKVVYRAARATLDLGMPTLRFNFRGAGRSAGVFDGGIGEADDVRAALARMATICPGRPLVAGGFSFGAWLSVAVGAADPQVSALISIGTPISIYGSDHLSAVHKPILFVHGSSDPFCPSAELDAIAHRMPGPVRVVRVEGAGHLLTGREGQVYDAVREFLRETLEPQDGDTTPEPNAGRGQPPGGS